MNTLQHQKLIDKIVLMGDFADLTIEFELRPIRNKKEYQKAIGIAERLVGRNDLGKDQSDYLETLTMLIEAYEERRFPILCKDLNPVTILKQLLNSNGLSPSDLGRILGQRELGSKILKGDRELSKMHIRKLADYFKIDPCLLF